MQQSEKTEVHLAATNGHEGPVQKPNAAMRLIDAITKAFAGAQATRRKERKPAPRMVCSPPEVIAAWNAAAAQRSDRMDRVGRKQATALLDRATKDSGQHPNFPKARVHRQHRHPLQDKHGAYTLVGKVSFAPSDHPDEFDIVPRRKWLAGISAQRGF